MSAALLLTVGLFTADAAAEAPRIDQRYAEATAKETPDFRKHVVPLLGRLGCNGRACHGSFQGQGGFRLSLFGYDFKSDHENLLAGEKPRTIPTNAAESLILRKPLEAEPHEGGKRLTLDTWQHRVLTQWVNAGAKGVDKETPEFVRLDVTPTEMVAKQAGDTWQLKAVAVWSDGSREDVTPLCRFQSNNDQVAAITEHGLVTAKGPGDSHVVAFYDNGVVPVPVMQPVSTKIGPEYPSTPTPTKIDELVVQKLQKLGVVQAETCTDAEFLRRVSLDIAGTLPTAAETEAFLADTSADKRARKIDQLLDHPGYASWWATKFADWTGNNSQYLNNLNGADRGGFAATSWYKWIEKRIAQNMPYDQLVEGIVLATSRVGEESYEDYCKRMTGYFAKDAETSFVDQPHMSYYWARRNFVTPEDRALGFAYTFLGVRIQCAQCHKHPFDQWTKDDFDRFKGFFGRVRYGNAPGTGDDEKRMMAALDVDTKGLNGNKLQQLLGEKAKEGHLVPFRELFVAAPARPKDNAKNKDNGKEKKRQVVGGRTAKVLGGEEFTIDEMADPRTALMDWMRDADNPYFAKAIVNRVWSSYFHRGIVEPSDDLSLANPPCNEELFDYLAAGFREHNYDLKWLHREITNSRTYQLSWRSNDTNKLDDRNFSRAIPRRLPAEVAYDAMKYATASDQEAAKFNENCNGRAIADPVVSTRNGNGNKQYALTVFGRSIRESNCDCDRSAEPSLLQTVFLQNDQELLDAINRRGGWVDSVVKSNGGSGKDEPDVAQRRKQAERVVDRLKEALKKAEANSNEDRLAKVRKDLADAEERAAKFRSVAETPQAPVQPMDVDGIIRQAYLRTVTRPPTDEEVARARAYFESTGDMAVGARDVLWALLNTKEFVVNH